MIRSLLVTTLALVVLPTVVRADGPYTLERKLEKGSRKRVIESRRSVYTMMWKASGASVGVAEEKKSEQRYVEEVKKPQPVVLWREYEHSTRVKQKPKGRQKPIKTSLHGRSVLVIGLEMKPDAGQWFKPSKEDKEATRFDRLARAMLPPRKVVASKESWRISAKALCEALYGPLVPASNRKGSAKVTLRSVKTVKGRELATLRVKLKIQIERADNFPGITMNLRGEVKWAVEEGTMMEARLEGPSSFEWAHDKDGNRAVLAGKGTIRWSYKAELLPSRAPINKLSRRRGAHPTPGTRALVCTLNPGHKLDLKTFPNCTLCGKKFQKGWKCPDGHPWPWQYCPHDGAPFEEN